MTTKSGDKGGMAVDTALVRELAEMLGETGLSEIEVEDGDRKIRVSRAMTAAPVAAPVAVAAPLAAAPAAAPAPVGSDIAPAAPASANAVKSPMVGTCYLAADPEAPVFASVGATVAEGDTILIIEAMKVMNPITAPRGGKLSAMLVANGQPVEFDQPLFVID
jgi:acetyl-CoA carboxylase biotin carboxyl carrier protein